ncbi:MAG TPA: Sir2 family NAD-dependent protein deacetylase [Acidimicrobiales bacterium]|nr:Sir2 family NAD-dependent protein deacetylase [Acidimicrobiales bacterium]
MSLADLAVRIELARQLIDAADAITVLTGAGISTDSGIPDFRGPNGLWTKNPEAEKTSDIRYYVADPDLRQRNWAARVAGAIWADREPNDGHRALVRLEERGKLHTLITQNVDGLHQKAGSDPARIVEIHGTTKGAMCLSCDWRGDIEAVLARVRDGEADPHCTECGGILKSATISFGQALVAEDLERAAVAAEECDLFLAIGTSLAVYPIASTVPIAKKAGAGLVIVNNEPTEFDPVADVVLQASITEVLPRIVD